MNRIKIAVLDADVIYAILKFFSINREYGQLSNEILKKIVLFLYLL